MTNKFVTRAGFAKMTKQEIFDAAATHVLKNGKPSVRVGATNDVACQYGGIGCAASPFLLPSKRDAMDARSISWLSMKCEGLVPDHFAEFVLEIQRCHDNPVTLDSQLSDLDFIAEFKASMRQIAVESGLDSSVLGSSE